MSAKLWRVEQLAEYLGVPHTWIYDRTRERGPEKVPHLKLGKYIRFNPDSVEFRSWLSAHVVGLDTQLASQPAETKHPK
jgi:Helix-turn-helix domain